jgi:hypothetical protein
MMSQEFEMSMIGELSFFLGLEVKQTKYGTFICQRKSMNALLKRFDMDNSKPVKTPMSTNAHLDLDEGSNRVDLKLYGSMIDSLCYLTASRSDIMFSICMCARFQASPKVCHMMVIKRILRYLRQTPNLGLLYPKGAHFILVGYSDSDCAGCKIDRKSTSSTYQLLGRFLVSWSSKKQNSIALSTVEAEYVSTGSCYAQLLLMKQTLLNYGVKFDCMPLLCDNESSMKIATNPIQHKITKRIDIRHHFLRDHVRRGDIMMESVRIDDQLADIFTKALDETDFYKLSSEIMFFSFYLSISCSHIFNCIMMLSY